MSRDDWRSVGVHENDANIAERAELGQQRSELQDGAFPDHHGSTGINNQDKIQPPFGAGPQFGHPQTGIGNSLGCRRFINDVFGP